MGRRRTLTQVAWPVTDDFCKLAAAWRADLSTHLLALVWEGYDLLAQEVLAGIDLAQADLALETDVTQCLEPRIARAMTGDEPFQVQHGRHEPETRHADDRAQSPQYDIAFFLRANERVMWPLEAKVLRTQGTVAEYVRAIREELLTCRYAPFSSQGAMLGYILSGSPADALVSIGRSLVCELVAHPAFPERCHSTSDHTRDVPLGKDYPSTFRCHHLVMPLTLG